MFSDVAHPCVKLSNQLSLLKSISQRTFNSSLIIHNHNALHSLPHLALQISLQHTISALKFSLPTSLLTNWNNTYPQNLMRRTFSIIILHIFQTAKLAPRYHRVAL